MDSKPVNPVTLIVSLAILVLTETPLFKGFSALGMISYAALGLTRLVQIGLVFGVVYRFEGSFSAIGLGKQRALRGLLRGLLWSFGFGAVAILGLAVLSIWVSNPIHLLKTRLPADPANRVFFFIAGGLIAPVAEELFFRGVLFGYLRRRGFVFALVLSTVIFVAIHIPKGIPVPQIVGGLVFALSYELEKSLWTPILIHATGNMVLFSLSLM